MFINLDHPVLLKIIETLQRRYWYTHCLWSPCLENIQNILHEHRQRGSTTIHVDEITDVLDAAADTIRFQTFTESDIIEIARQRVRENERIWPDGFYIDRFLRQFGINTEAIPAPEGQRYIPPLGLRFWDEIFVPSSYRNRLDPTVFKLFEEIHHLLELQSRNEDDIIEALEAYGLPAPEEFTGLDFRARDCRVYERLAQLTRLDGNIPLLEKVIELRWALIPGMTE